MSASFLTQGHHVVYICPDIIFQILLLCSRPMMSCDYDIMCLFIITKKKNKNKNKIKRKIDKRKRKMLVSKVFHNIWDFTV